MKHVQTGCYLATLFFLTGGCTTSRFQPNQSMANASMPGDSAPVTVFLLERDLLGSFDRLGTISLRSNQTGFGMSQRIDNELQKAGREKGANGAIRIQHGTYGINWSSCLICCSTTLNSQRV